MVGSNNALERIAFVGGGKMGEAIMGGWLDAESDPAAAITPQNVIVADPGSTRRIYLTERYGVECVSQAGEIDDAGLVVLAVKPQVMMGVLDEIAQTGRFRSTLFVSIATGMATARLQEALPPGAHLVRVMPNTPLLVGEGATAVCSSPSSTKADVQLVCDLFASLGKVFFLEENLIDAVSAVSGSGPAYVAAMIESLAKAGVEQGLQADLSAQLATQTVYGTMKLIRETGQSAEEVRVAVCSPGGSTLAALAAMEHAGLDEVYRLGVAAAVQRSKELGAC